MALLVIDCPHCNAKKMTFRIFGSQVLAEAPGVATRAINAAAECQSCLKPIATVLVVEKRHHGTDQMIGNMVGHPADIGLMGLRVGPIWPEPPAPTIADSLPETVRRALQQAEINFRQPDCEEASATMYRRALDTGLKEAFPSVKGDIFKRIEKLVEQHEFPKALGEWAHEVRLIGNDGAHDVEGVTREDLSAARDFVDAVLRYSFTLPQMIAERRALASPPQAPAGQPQA